MCYLMIHKKIKIDRTKGVHKGGDGPFIFPPHFISLILNVSCFLSSYSYQTSEAITSCRAVNRPWQGYQVCKGLLRQNGTIYTPLVNEAHCSLKNLYFKPDKINSFSYDNKLLKQIYYYY